MSSMIASAVARSRFAVGSSKRSAAGSAEGLRKPDPLLLAARELRREVIGPIGQADFGEELEGPGSSVPAPWPARQSNVLGGGEGADQP